MILKQKIIEAKVARRRQLINMTLGLVSISLLGILIVIFVSTQTFNHNSVETVSAIPDKEITVDEQEKSAEIPDEQFRQTYIGGLRHYQEKLKPELNNIDLTSVYKARSERLSVLEDEALSEFTAGHYVEAINKIAKLNQLAESTITESRQKYEQTLSKAQQAYAADNYAEAKSQITLAMSFNKSSTEATTLFSKINKLPEILPQLKKIEKAKVEKKLRKELSLINDLLKIAPERTAAIKRKKVIEKTIGKLNFKAYISQSYQALKQGHLKTAKQKIIRAKTIFPNRKEIAEATLAVQKYETNQRFEIHQLKAKLAIESDDWLTAKKQLGLALQENSANTAIQKSFSVASKIVNLNTEFHRYIEKPDQLSNKQLVFRLKKQINKASELTRHSPSLATNANALSRLIRKMNTKIPVQVISDEQTTILVRGIGIVGETLSKTIRLLPGKYTFEGKRKGYKSKLMNVQVPFDNPHFSVNIRCDEPI